MVQEAVNKLKLRSTILDGQIVALDTEGIPRFQLLQQWQKRPRAIRSSISVRSALVRRTRFYRPDCLTTTEIIARDHHAFTLVRQSTGIARRTTSRFPSPSAQPSEFLLRFRT